MEDLPPWLLQSRISVCFSVDQTAVPAPALCHYSGAHVRAAVLAWTCVPERFFLAKLSTDTDVWFCCHVDRRQSAAQLMEAKFLEKSSEWSREMRTTQEIIFQLTAVNSFSSVHILLL